MKNILILGALGHIGSRLIRSFVNNTQGVNLTLIDNLGTNKQNSLFNMSKSINFNFIEGDIRANIQNIYGGSVDCVVHLAALTNPTESAKDPENFVQYNEACTREVLEFSKNRGCELIFISSTSVYSTSGLELKEDQESTSLQGQSPYAKCKLNEEALILQAINIHSLNAKILRFGTIYGTSPGMRFHTAVNKFCWDSSTKNIITAWETALDQKRPYLDLTDAINAIHHAIFNDICPGVYNCATNTSTVQDIIDIIKQIKPDVTIKKVKSEIMNNLSYSVSSEKLLNSGFRYSGSLELAIKQTLSLLDTISS